MLILAVASLAVAVRVEAGIAMKAVATAIRDQTAGARAVRAVAEVAEEAAIKIQYLKIYF